jgi:membrane protease YdiL (CAAX protease family)
MSAPFLCALIYTGDLKKSLSGRTASLMPPLKTRTKLFFILWGAATISTILVLPYVFSVQSETLKKSDVSFRALILSAILQGGITFGISAFFGLLLAEKTGFQLPILKNLLKHKTNNLGSTGMLSIMLGIIAGMSISILDKFIFPQSGLSSIKVPLWQRSLACFYGGISEEILMRLFLVSLIVFIGEKIFTIPEYHSIVVWAAIIITSVLFGLGHLPTTSAVVEITPIIITRAIVLNGIGGLIFGWLYWKKGFEFAIISHFSTDVVLHIIVSSLFP